MAEYNNTLDTWYQSCSSPIQSVLSSPYETISGWLHAVTGEPDTVAGQCATYERMGSEVLEVGNQLTETAKGISQWEGDAHNAFLLKMGEVRGNFDKVGPAISQTQEILRAAAETSVEAANMILSVVRSVIEFLVQSLAISAALAVFTFGASFGAWIAANLAKGAHAVAQISQGLARVAQVLVRIAQLLEKLALILKKVAQILKELRAFLKLVKELKKGASLTDKLIISGVAALVKKGTATAANEVLDGVSAVTGVEGLSMPKGLPEIRQAGEDAWAAKEASDRATQANTGVDLN